MSYIPELYALLAILLERKSYNEAIFKISMEEQLSQSGKKKFIDNVNGVLRHYFCLSFEVMDLLPYKRESEEHILSLVALYELRYHKSVPYDNIYQSYKEAFHIERLIGQAKENFDILLSASKKAFRIPEEVKSSPYLYNSLILEVPDFLLRILSKEDGGQSALNIASYLHKKPVNTFASLKENQEELLSSDEFENISFDDGSTLYSCKKSISLKEVRNKDLYPLGYLEALLYSKLQVPELTPKVLLAGVENGFQILPLALKTDDKLDSEVTAVFDDAISYRSGVDAIKYFKLKKVRILSTKLNLLKTFRSYDYYDTVVCFGQDTKLGLARRTPSILPCLKDYDFERSRQKQLDALLELAPFVKKGGNLVLLNHGLTKEETLEVVLLFLGIKKDFAMVSKEMVFPNFMDCDGGFFAILKRKAK